MIENVDYLAQPDEAAVRTHRAELTPLSFLERSVLVYHRRVAVCFPWDVTAAGARHLCLRKVDPLRVWELFGEESVEFTKLERTATGKTEKRALRDREWADRDRKVA